MSRISHTNAKSGQIQRVLSLILLLVAAIALPQSALAEGTPANGTKGWSYFIALWEIGYTTDPVEACKRTAKNHMNSELVDMRPSIYAQQSTLAYDCKYYNFIRSVGPQEIPPQWYGGTEFTCEPGYLKRQPGVCVKKPERPAPPPPPCAAGAPGSCVGNPVVVSSGAKIQSETDFAGSGSWPMRVNRTYRTLREDFSLGHSAGEGWSFSFDRLFYISEFSSSGRPSTITMTNGDGSYFRFYWDDKQKKYRSGFDKTTSLEALDSSYEDWIVTHADGRIDRFKKFYDSDHTHDRFLMVSSHSADGQAGYYTYHPEYFTLTTISDGLGRKLDVEWTSYAISKISGSEGSVHYSYDWLHLPGNDTEAPFTKRLIAVEYFDAAGTSTGKKLYHYEDEHSWYLLTGITDENGTRFATYAYDENGRTVLSEHAGGANRHTFAYPDVSTRVITDPLGTARTYSVRDFGSGGVITGQSKPAGAGSRVGANVLTFSGSLLASLTDFNGNKTCYVNDITRGLETSRIAGLTSSASCPYDDSEPLSSAGSRRISTQWHPNFMLRAAVAEPNRVITYLYNGQRDTSGKVIECADNAVLPNDKPIAVVCKKTIQPTLDANGEQGFSAESTSVPRVWTYRYNVRGQLLSATGPINAHGKAESEVRIYYEDSSPTHHIGDLASVTNSAGEVMQFLEYTASGLPSRVKRATAQTVTLEYGPRQRLASIAVEDSTGAVERSSYDYDLAGQLLRTTSADGSILNFVYDAAHRLIEISDNAGNRLHFELDLMGNVIRAETYGPDGRLVQTVSRSFDALNRLERELGGADQTGIAFKYDGNGNLTSVMDQLGRITTMQYDAFDRVVRDSLPPSSLTSSRNVIDYTYDHQDHLTSMADLRQLVTRYKVDPFGQRTRITSPDTGTTSATFDRNGDLVSSEDARGIATAYEFDTAGRLIKAGGNTYEYGLPSSSSSGMLTRMHDNSGETAYSYDGFGRLLTKSQSIVIGGVTRQFDLRFTHGASDSSTGHVTSITYPSGNRIQFTHDEGGRVSSLTLVRRVGFAPVSLLSGISYMPFGQVKGWAWGDGKGSNQRYERMFDLEGRVISYPLGHPAVSGVVRTLDYDAAGRIIAATHSGNARASALDQRYSYDGLDRLTGFDAAATSQRFSYDKNGNRIAASFGGGTYINKISADSNRLMTTSGPGPAKYNRYDAAGNLLSDGTYEYQYGADGRLESSTSGGTVTRYRYNWLGQRVAKIAGPEQSTYYVYDEDGHLIGEYDGTGAVIQETVYLDDLPVAVIKAVTSRTNANAGIYYVYSDHLQTPRVITRAADNKIAWRWDSADPFGLSQPEESQGADKLTYNLRFPGQVFDKETNTNYNYFRDYDPQIGRYMQSDPIGLYGGINTYAYVSGNPVAGIDPIGLADLNLFSPKSVMQYKGANAWNVPGTYTVAGHGNNKILQDAEGRTIYAEDLARIIKRDPNWYGKPIIIGSCNTGKDRDDGEASFAQELADKLNVPVKASLEFVWFGEEGLFGTSRDMVHPPKPGQSGRWRTFQPRRQ